MTTFVSFILRRRASFDLAYNSDFPIFSFGIPNDDVDCVYLGEDPRGVSILDVRMSKPSLVIELTLQLN